MAISVVNSSSAIQGVSVSSVTSSATFTSTTGNLLIAIGAADTTTTEGATPWSDGTNTWNVPARSPSFSTDPTIITLAYAKSITGKAGEAVTYTLANASGFPCVCLIEVSGCDTSAPNDVSTTYATANSNSVNTPLITPAAGAHILVITAAGGNATRGQSVTNNGTGAATWTTIKNDSGTGEPFLMAYAIVTADGTSTYGVTYNNSSTSGTASGAGIAAFKAAAGGGATPIKPPMRTLRGAGL